MTTLPSVHLDEIPLHVPPELVRDFDFLGMPAGEDLFDWYGKLHDGPDIFYTPRNEGHWVFTRHADMEHVLKDYDSFSSRYVSIPKSGVVLPIPPIDVDPPKHGEFRRLIAPFFSPKSIENLEESVRALTVELIDGFHSSGKCEFMTDFAFRMPIGIFLRLVDLPEQDRLPLLAISKKMARGTGEVQRAGFEASFAYLAEKLAERRVNPGNDILTAMLFGTVGEGRTLTEDELLGMGSLVLQAGLDTVAGTLGFIAKFLAEHPEERNTLIRHPEMIPNALEELLRRFEGVVTVRMMTRDMEYKGVALREGDLVLLSTTLAGIDERRYPNARKVDFSRADKKTLSFGRGPHQCVGAYLARTELRVFISEWLKRIPDFEVDRQDTVLMVSGRTSMIERLPLRWSVRGA
jgi:cytochrome P450